MERGSSLAAIHVAGYELVSGLEVSGYHLVFAGGSSGLCGMCFYFTGIMWGQEQHAGECADAYSRFLLVSDLHSSPPDTIICVYFACFVSGAGKRG